MVLERCLVRGLDLDRYEVKTGEVQGNLWERCTVTRAICFLLLFEFGWVGFGIKIGPDCGGGLVFGFWAWVSVSNINFGLV